MSDDPTESARRDLLPQMPARYVAAVERGEPTWDTEMLKRDFEVLGFLAPLVHVRRKSDGVEGTLEFVHRPRWYFDFQAVER
jgi:hypothetical protein